MMKTKEGFSPTIIEKTYAWLYEPTNWTVNEEAETLTIRPNAETDFWQRTFYGFRNDNAPVLYRHVKGNFRMTTKVTFQPLHKYDQAGLVVRVSEDVWLKASMEYIPGGDSKLGSVVTNFGYSDWATQPFSVEKNELYFRITKKGDAFFIDYSLDGEKWIQIRMAHLHVDEEATYMAGLYACSPTDTGYEATFEFLDIEEITEDTDVYL